MRQITPCWKRSFGTGAMTSSTPSWPRGTDVGGVAIPSGCGALSPRVERTIAGNPLTGIRLPKSTSRTRNALTVEQVEAFAEVVGPWWRPFVLVLAYCGLRPGSHRSAPEAPRRPRATHGLTGHKRAPRNPGRGRHQDPPGPHRRGSGFSLGRTACSRGRPRRRRRRCIALHHPVGRSDPPFELAVGVGTGCGTRPPPSCASPTGPRSTSCGNGGQPARAKRGARTAAAASLGHDPAIFLRTYAHLTPGTSEPWPTQWTRLVRRLCRPNATRVRFLSQAWCRAWISRGWPDAVGRSLNVRAPGLDFSVGLPGFEPGTS